MLKRTVALLLALACLLSLAGCCRSESTSAPVCDTSGVSLCNLSTSQKDGPLLPPTLNSVCPKMTFDKYGQSSNGDISLRYIDSTGGGQVRSSVDAYLALLEDYGYTLVYSDVLEKSDYAYCSYWLESSDSSLEQVRINGRSCHLFIGSQVDPGLGFRDIGIYYSPTILPYYIEGADLPDGGGSGGGTVTPSNPGGSNTTIRCSKCGGDGKMTCTNCNGLGYKESQVSTPNYSGSGPRYGTVKEACYKCHYSGTITCTRCGGEGRHS